MVGIDEAISLIRHVQLCICNHCYRLTVFMDIFLGKGHVLQEVGVAVLLLVCVCVYTMMVILIIQVEFSEAGRGTPGMCPPLLEFCHFVCHNIGYKYIGKFLSQVTSLLAI